MALIPFLTFTLLIVILDGIDVYSNPTTNVTCGRFGNCLVDCSDAESCNDLYFIFDNDWSVTEEKYNVTLLCTGDAACINLKIFGNRTSSVNIEINTGWVSPYTHNSIDMHILFGNYSRTPQIATIICNLCQDSQFYYTSLKNNVSLINSPSDGIVIHKCITCGFYNTISAMNIYQLQFTCGNNGCDQISVYPPIHNNYNESFIFTSNSTGVGELSHLFFFFINGLYGKKIICNPYNTTLTYPDGTTTNIIFGCDSFYQYSVIVYCGPTFNMLDNADDLLSGGYSTDCASIYDHAFITSYLPSAILPINTFVFNAHRLYTDYYTTPYDDYLQNNYTAIFIMTDSVLPGETLSFSDDIFYLPHAANIFIFCNPYVYNSDYSNSYLSHCSGTGTDDYRIFHGTNTLSMTVVGMNIQYSSYHSGTIFHSYLFQNSRNLLFYLDNADSVHLNPLVTEDLYQSTGVNIGTPYIYIDMTIRINSPEHLIINCNYESGCDYSYLIAQTGSYKYIPANWDITCYASYYGGSSCYNFEIKLGDGSRCELDVDNICTNWYQGSTDPTPTPTNIPSITPTSETYNPTITPTNHPTQTPTFNPTNIPSYPTTNPTVFPSESPISSNSNHDDSSTTTSFTHQLLSSSIYSVIAIGFVVFLVFFISCFGVIHKYNSTKSYFIKHLKAADDAKPLTLITLSLGIWDFLSDWNWAFSIDYNEYIYYFYASIALNIISWTLNMIYLFRLIRKYKKDTNLSIWLRSYVLYLIIFTMISGKASTAISVCNCHLFGLSVFEMGLPLFRIQMEINRWMILFNTVLQNIPQIILQMLYTSVYGSLEISTLFALLSSTCSIILTISIFVVQVGIHWNPKVYDITLNISNKDSMDPLLSKRRYLRRKTAIIISETISIPFQCIQVDKIYHPLIIRAYINDERTQQNILSVLNEKMDQLKQRLKQLFCLKDDLTIKIEQKNKTIVYNIKKTNYKQQPLLDDFDNDMNYVQMT